jgi:Uma2 family endonuclease
MLVTAPTPYRWTREEYYKLGAAGLLLPEARVELIEGEILQMPPQGPAHSTGTRTAQESLRNAFGRGFDVRPQLPLSLGQASDPEPDLAVVPGNPLDYLDGHPSTALLVVEVSDDTLAFDRREKASLYARAGLQDYWIVNLPEAVVEVYRDPRPQAESPYGYGYTQVTRHAPGDTLTPLAAPQAKIPVENLLPRPRRKEGA